MEITNSFAFLLFAKTEILSSSFAAALYLTINPLPKGKKVYIIGHEGIGDELELAGIPHIGGVDDAHKSPSFAAGSLVQHDRDVGAVVVGLDLSINYYKIQYAQLCLNGNKDCKFIATNCDEVAHVTDAQEWAAGGAMVGAIKGCTGKDPIVVGKPSSLLIEHLLVENDLSPERICMVGDRLDTDMLFGINHNMKTILTLSGVTRFEELMSSDNKIIPQYYVDSVKDFLS